MFDFYLLYLDLSVKLYRTKVMWPTIQFQAAQNLVVLSREDAGAEQIFRNDGVKLIQKLLQSKQEDVVLSALRTLVGLCTGHQSRVSVTIPSKFVHCIIFKFLTGRQNHHSWQTWIK